MTEGDVVAARKRERESIWTGVRGCEERGKRLSPKDGR